MNKEQLFEALDYVNASRERRAEMSSLVLNNLHLMEPLLEIIFQDTDPISSKAAWVVEFVVKEDLGYLFPYIDFFTASVGALKLDSSIRPMAKICELLIEGYFKKKKNDTQEALKEKNLEEITTACFDWLIGDHKVATKAYSMTALLLLGRKFDWIHPELKMVLEQNYSSGSAAYKARARMTLEKINKSR